MTSIADSASLPVHARIIALPEVWMEGEAIAQFARVAASPGCVRAAAMPDLHAGRGIPVGAAFAFAERVLPELVGGDAGCGARLMVTTIDRARAPSDRIERRVEQAFAEDPLADCDARALFAAVWRAGVRGLGEVEGVPEAMARLAALEPEDDLGPSGDSSVYEAAFGRALGSIGGGNHFAEVTRVAEIRDREAAKALGLARDRLAVLVHTGSRGLGGALAARWAGERLDGASMQAYLGELAGACRFARANRFLLAYRLLTALEAARPLKIAGRLDITHNTVTREPVGDIEAWVHRKGAAPAHDGQMTVVLGSRGAPSWVLSARGNQDGLCSVAHGAGRRMGRGEAREKIATRYKRAELSRTRLGGRVICDDKNLLYEEHPDAYKPIEPVMQSLVEAGLAAPVAALEPVLTIKR